MHNENEVMKHAGARNRPRTRMANIIKVTGGTQENPGIRVRVPVDHQINNRAGVMHYLAKRDEATGKPCFMMPEDYARLSLEQRRDLMRPVSEVAEDMVKAKMAESSALADSARNQAAIATELMSLRAELAAMKGGKPPQGR